ncbi:transcription/translation regulatory transformer protein RfaH [Ferrimonas senticii]|uniref:transcription/translation regulatory transformer protein RfaH n=1 Tax=Ferrimonas senticii TaxID=394566 RepID=UPI00042802D3|nr:transcription/translation regulatory transformer protein RfaH [Ferrimonas senticii]
MLAWYLLHCKSRKEQAVVSWFAAQDINTFVPEIAVQKLVAGKKVQRTEALFPGYLFVRFDPHVTPFARINGAPNVGSIVRTNKQLLPVETSLVVSLREAQNRRTEPMDELPKRGDKIRIHQGPFANLEAIFDEPDGDKRSMLLIEMMGKPQRLSLDNLSFGRLR